jgi:hypothetical protein
MKVRKGRKGLNVQGYVSPVLVARVHEQLVARGLLVRANSYSEIIRVSLEITLGLLSSKPQPAVVSTITSGSEALDYLRANGLSVAQIADKTRQRALHDELAEEYRHYEFPSQSSSDVPLVAEPTPEPDYVLDIDVEEYLKKIMSIKTYS